MRSFLHPGATIICVLKKERQLAMSEKYQQSVPSHARKKPQAWTRGKHEIALATSDVRWAITREKCYYCNTFHLECLVDISIC